MNKKLGSAASRTGMCEDNVQQSYTEPTIRDGRARGAERVIVVSLMKAGTHLIQELMVALGFRMYGQSRIDPEIRPTFDPDTQRNIARMVYGDDAGPTPSAGCGANAYQSYDHAWEALGWAWQMRFGMPLANRYGAELINTKLVKETLDRTASSNFSETPKGLCWILPVFDVKEIDGRFLSEWSQTKEPRIIFNYRDPRDVVLSMVNFLSGQTSKGIGNFSEFKVFSRTLDAKPTLKEKLTYALSDPSFPGFGDFEKSLWLLHHPDVCKVSFEELVGPEGGGSAEAQQRAVGRVLNFLGLDVAPEGITERLFRRDSFSFFKGQIGAWREAFTRDHQALFKDRFDHVLSTYGYS